MPALSHTTRLLRVYSCSHNQCNSDYNHHDRRSNILSNIIMHIDTTVLFINWKARKDLKSLLQFQWDFLAPFHQTPLANTETLRVRSTHGAPLCSKMEAEPAHIVVPCRPFSPYGAVKWTWGNHNHRHLPTPTDTLGIRPWQRNTNSVFYCMFYISTVSALSAPKWHPTQDKGPCLSLEARMSYSLQAT